MLPGRSGDAPARGHDAVVHAGTCRAGTRSRSRGYHIREAGSTAAQELAFTLKDGLTYVEQQVARGMDVDDFAPRLSFFFNAHIDFFEEIAKYRAARRIWARELRETFGAQEPEVVADALPHADRRRVADGAAAAEQHRAHGDRGARRRARRHAVAAHQLLRRGARAADRGGGPGRAADAADHRPRDRRDEHDRPARRLLLRRGADRSAGAPGLRRTSRKIDELGGMVEAVKRGFPQREIADAAYSSSRSTTRGERIAGRRQRLHRGRRRRARDPPHRPGARAQADRPRAGRPRPPRRRRRRARARRAARGRRRRGAT